MPTTTWDGGSPTTATGWWATSTDLLAMMDAVGVEAIVNLDGRWGDELVANVDRYDRRHPGRFITFCHVDWSILGSDDTRSAQVDRLVSQLAASVEAGARGVKVWKDLGLSVRDSSGALVKPDDSRVVAVLQAAGELGLPVLIHTADPVAFFEPLSQEQRTLGRAAGAPGVVVRCCRDCPPSPS